MTPDQLQIFLDIATLAAEAGGAVLQSCLGNLQDIQEKGRSGDLVTEADKASEIAVLDILKRHVPDHAILTEESGELGNRESLFLWAIDPLDGTTNFAHQYPFFSTSVALLIDGVPAVGAVFDPWRGELFRGAKGLGATRNRKPIHVSKTDNLANSLLVTGFAYDRRETSDNNYAEFCHLTHLTQGVRRGGSAALDLCYVACGRLDGYWERGLSPWDIAAGIVIVEEAGGKVTVYDSSPLDIKSGRILATNGHLHASLSQALMETPPLSSWSSQ
ncbi:MAG: inositol monophosphatase family protein [Lyngbya sp.]|nr:inositol monophosphatase family protein [Lyngbya sp.]